MDGRLLLSVTLREVQSEITQEDRDGDEKLDFRPVHKSCHQVISGKKMTSSGLSLKDLLCVWIEDSLEDRWKRQDEERPSLIHSEIRMSLIGHHSPLWHTPFKILTNTDLTSKVFFPSLFWASKQQWTVNSTLLWKAHYYLHNFIPFISNTVS